MKPENRFIAKVHRALPDYVYGEKTANPFRGGTLDCFYEGDFGYHWIEYKWLPKTPVRSFTPDISQLQLKWLMRAYNHRRDPWVVVGCPEGCFVLDKPEQWTGPVKVADVELHSVKYLVRLIEEQIS